MDLKQRARRHRNNRVSGNERRPRPHTHLDRGLAVELHVYNWIVPPIVDRVGDGRSRKADLVKQGRVIGRRKGHRALARLRRVPLAQCVRNQYPGAVRTLCAVARQPQHGQVEQRPRLHQMVEDRVVAEHPVRFHIDAAGIQAAQGHAAGGARLAAVDNAGDRARIAGRLEGAPTGMEQVGGKESVTHRGLLSDLDCDVSGVNNGSAIVNPRPSVSRTKVFLSPHSSPLSPRFWAVRPAAFPCAGGFPPQRPPTKTRPAPSVRSSSQCARQPKKCRISLNRSKDERLAVHGKSWSRQTLQMASMALEPCNSSPVHPSSSVPCTSGVTKN